MEESKFFTMEGALDEILRIILINSSLGFSGTPSGTTFAVHNLVVIDDDLWTITLDVWSTGGGA